jgi:pyruvate formate lyase activating enzyme
MDDSIKANDEAHAEEHGGPADEAPRPLRRPLTRRDAIKYCTLGAVGLAAVGSAVGFFATARRKERLTRVFKGDAPKSLWKWSREAMHYLKLGRNVNCKLCPNDCILAPGDRSVCRVKVNLDGKLYTLAYGDPCAVHVDPIEKKPLLHFLPQTGAFSIATAGCNLRCLNCQNWEISQSRPEDLDHADMMPEQVVVLAKQAGCTSIAYTYSEPTSFYEYMYDTGKIAHAQGLKNVWVTNGYINRKPLEQLCEVLDAANVDLKSYDEKIYNELNAGHLQPILDTLKTLRDRGVWFEVTTLMVPTYLDDMDMIRRMCDWLIKQIGPDYPLHFSRFYPQHKLNHLPPTPVATLRRAREVGLKAGLHYVYVGNVGLDEVPDSMNTYCPGCGKLLVERRGYFVVRNDIVHGACKYCGRTIAGVWETARAADPQETPVEAHTERTGG